METLTDSKMKLAYRIQSVGGLGKFDMEIFINAGRELNNADKKNIGEFAEKIQESIAQESIRLNPKSAIEAQEEKEGILNLFGSETIYVEEIPNGYCNRYCCKHLPWFVVTTKVGRITIGWRKRVINIDWEGSAITKKANELFPQEDVTKGDKFIHAWGYEKAKEYIGVLLSQK